MQVTNGKNVHRYLKQNIKASKNFGSRWKIKVQAIFSWDPPLYVGPMVIDGLRQTQQKHLHFSAFLSFYTPVQNTE